MEWTRFKKVDDAWDAMLADIKAAKKEILCESYVFYPDKLGSIFIDIFKNKARGGVRVKIIADTVGSYALFNSREADDLRKSGVELQFFNKIRAWRIDTFTSWFFRDHRKIMVIDEKIGYTGGVGLQSGMKGWRDTHLRLTGEGASELKQSFDHIWESMKKTSHPPVSPPSSRSEKAILYENAPLTLGKKKSRQNFVYKNILETVRRAKSYIYFTTPYFVPPRGLLKSLKAAAKRGVDVRLLLPMASDVSFVDRASHSYFNTCLKSGVRLYRYKGGMIHSKTGVSDDRWVCVGSSNLDNLSLFLNYEANLVSNDSKLIFTIKNDFLEDISFSEELLAEKWAERSFLDKFIEIITWPLHVIF